MTRGTMYRDSSLDLVAEDIRRQDVLIADSLDWFGEGHGSGSRRDLALDPAGSTWWAVETRSTRKQRCASAGRSFSACRWRLFRRSRSRATHGDSAARRVGGHLVTIGHRQPDRRSSQTRERARSAFAGDHRQSGECIGSRARHGTDHHSIPQDRTHPRHLFVHVQHDPALRARRRTGADVGGLRDRGR